MSTDVLLTIFTPAYNRPHALRRVGASLAAQTAQAFEWLIVDDGSGPEVRDAVEAMHAEFTFPIRYIWQENAGKHAAHNRAVDSALGIYFAVLDDDDSLLPDAVARILHHWNEMGEEERAGFVSIIGLCVDQEGRLHAPPVALAPGARWLDSDYIEFSYKLGYGGERWGAYRTQVLREFPYPVAAGQSAYMLESVTWVRMARHYRTRFINEVWRVWHTGHVSQSSQSGKKLIDYRRIAPNQVIVHRQHFVELGDQFRYDPYHVWLAAAHYTRFSLHAGASFGTMWRDAKGVRSKALWISALPFGVAGWLRDQPVMSQRRQYAPQGYAPQDVTQSIDPSAQLSPASDTQPARNTSNATSAQKDDPKDDSKYPPKDDPKDDPKDKSYG